MEKKRLTAVSLFSGCGGLDLGFEAAGFQILSAHDIDPIAVRNYNENLEPVANVSDVSSPSFAVPPGLDLVLSGSPCQGFSLVGKRNILDPRNSLFLTACELVAKSQPRAAIFENVPGALAGAHGAIWTEGVRILGAAGYNVSSEMIAMNDHGLSQMRRRIILIAFRDCDTFSLNNALDGDATPSLKKILRGAHNYDSGDQYAALTPGSSDWQIAHRIKQGMKLCDVRAGDRSVHSWHIPEVFGATDEKDQELLSTTLILRRSLRRRSSGDADPVQLEVLIDKFGQHIVERVENLAAKRYLTFDGQYVDLARRFNGKYRRLSWDVPSYTVDTNFGNARYFIHPEEPRGFSVREAARIQGFPDSYKFTGSFRDKFRLIGNAVPPSIAKKIAKKIKERLED